jgi:hypothetical protein
MLTRFSRDSCPLSRDNDAEDGLIHRDRQTQRVV